jgi:hypothetical protein
VADVTDVADVADVISQRAFKISLRMEKSVKRYAFSPPKLQNKIYLWRKIKLCFLYLRSQRGGEPSFSSAKGRKQTIHVSHLLSPVHMKLIAISIGLIALAVVLLGVKALFVRGGKFPEGHSHDLKEIARKKK